MPHRPVAHHQWPRWLKWEFWPYYVFYFPVYGVILYHALRLRSLTYFTLVNPGMRSGGFVAYSKFDLLCQLPPQNIPRSARLPGTVSVDRVLEVMQREHFSFPIVVKPDMGERGWKVEKINSVDQLHWYLQDPPDPLLIQEYVDAKQEYGIMYYRMPGAEKGVISSLMQREFLKVTGDGTSTLEQLLQRHPRCQYHLRKLRNKFSDRLNDVLQEGEQLVLEEIGNHNRGTTFLNVSHRVNDSLCKTFDRLASSLKGWYFGRFDVRCNSFEDLVQGRFKVVEVNGVNSEPAHIYDPHMRLWQAYRDLFTHWAVVFRIARANKKLGYRSEPVSSFLPRLYHHLQFKRTHPNTWYRGVQKVDRIN